MKRLMRLRASQHLRDLCAETEFNRAQLIQPFFVVEGLQSEEAIAGLRGNVRHNIPSALRQIEKDLSDGVTQFLLFPVPAEKRARGFDHQSTHKTISEIRRQFGSSLCLWVDTCLCSYTTHGHCAVLDERGIKLEETLDELAKSAVAFAEAGADGGEFGGHVHGVDEYQRRDHEDGCDNQRPVYCARSATLSRLLTQAGLRHTPSPDSDSGDEACRTPTPGLAAGGNKTESVGVLTFDEDKYEQDRGSPAGRPPAGA